MSCVLFPFCLVYSRTWPPKRSPFSNKPEVTFFRLKPNGETKSGNRVPMLPPDSDLLSLAKRGQCSGPCTPCGRWQGPGTSPRGSPQTVGDFWRLGASYPFWKRSWWVPFFRQSALNMAGNSMDFQILFWALHSGKNNFPSKKEAILCWES